MKKRLIIRPLQRFLITLVLLSSAFSLRAETYTIAVASNTVDTLISEVILRKAYQLLGHQLQIKRLPPKRALLAANAGSYDGDVQRIYSVAQSYPNLLRISPPINYIHGTGFVRKAANIEVHSWQGLKDYRVGIIRGIRFAETNVPKEVATTYRDYRELATALSSKKIDIGIYPLSNGIYQTLLIGEEDIVPLESPLERFDLYHYVHKKNLHLIDDLHQLFVRFEQQGILEKVRRRVLEITFKRAKSGLTPCTDNYACYDSVWLP